MSKRCKVCCEDSCRPCWLYVVSDKDKADTIKVGISTRPAKRLAEHRKKTGRDLSILFKREMRCEFDAMDAERRALKKLEPFRTRGDWFACPVHIVMAAIQ